MLSGNRRKALLVTLTVLIVMGLFVWYVGFAETWLAVREAGVCAFAATGCVMASVVIFQALAWRVLGAAVGHRPGMPTLLKATVVGMAGNIITPSTYLGGEPARVLYVGRKAGLPYGQVTAVVLLGKYLEALSFVPVLCVSAVIACLGLRRAMFSPSGKGLMLAVTLLSCAALIMSAVLWLSLARSWTPLAALCGRLAALGVFPRALIRLRGRAKEVEKQASQLFREQRRAVAPAFCCYLATHVAMFVKPLVFFFTGWRLGLSMGELGLMFFAGQLLLALQLLPSGVGTLDWGLLGVLRACGVGIADGQYSAFVLCLRFWDAAAVAAGALLAARLGLRLMAARRRGASGAEETSAVTV